MAGKNCQAHCVFDLVDPIDTDVGFDLDAIVWSVPTVPYNNGIFLAEYPELSVDQGWTTMDMNGDGRPDLVWSQDIDGYYDVFGLGVSPYWNVFMGQ